MKLAHILKAPLARLFDWAPSPQATVLWGEPLFHLMGRRAPRSDLTLGRLQRVLVVKLDQIGDVVLCSPFLRELRRNLPAAWITLVVQPKTLNLVERCQYVDEVLEFDWSVSGVTYQWRRRARALRLACWRLWPRRFDAAFVPRWDCDDYDASFLAYLSAARWRIGFSERVLERKRVANPGYDRLFTHVVDDPSLKHEVERNLDLIRELGGEVADTELELWLDPADDAFAADFISRFGVGPRPLAALVVGAREPKYCWPAERFAEVGAWLQREEGAELLLVGGPDDAAAAQRVCDALPSPALNAAGRASLRQTAALLKRCALVITNDTGPAHLAAAAGARLVVLSCHARGAEADGWGLPTRFFPWTPHAVVLQPARPLPPCLGHCEAQTAHCICDITVGQVRQAAASLL